MRKGIILSGFLHAAVMALLILGLPQFFQPLEVSEPIPVELVTLDENDIPEAASEELQADEPEVKEPVEEVVEEEVVEVTPPEPPKPVEPPPPEPPAPEPPPQQAEPTSPEPAEAPVAKPDPQPVLPQEAKPEPQPPPEPAERPLPPRPKTKPTIKLAKKEEPKPEPEPEQEPEPDRLSSILRNVEKLKTDLPQPRSSQVATARGAATASTADRSSHLEQAELIRAIKQQMERCWRIDPGARSAADLIVEIHVLLNPDGTVRRAEVLDGARMNRDAYFRSAAENARRAIYNCSPFRLPMRKFNQWQELTLTFNPEEMFGT